jgi:hypothetical protein
MSGADTPDFREAPSPFLCYTATIPQGLRKSTLVEVAPGHDMIVSDWRGMPPQQ